MASLTLHFAPLSCALVPLIALEEIGHPFEVELVALMAGEHRTPDFLALNPAGKVPVLVADGRPMTEVAAILTWLSGRFLEARLLPDPGDFRGRVAVLEDLAFCAATLQPFAPRIRLPQRYCDSDPERARTQSIKLIARQFEWIEARLGRQGPWWYGANWSAIDAHLGWVWAAVTRPPGVDPSPYPNLRRHAEAASKRPAVQRALGREQAALAELAAPGLAEPPGLT